jgi:hypothetical protein
MLEESGAVTIFDKPFAEVYLKAWQTSTGGSRTTTTTTTVTTTQPSTVATTNKNQAPAATGSNIKPSQHGEEAAKSEPTRPSTLLPGKAIIKDDSGYQSWRDRRVREAMVLSGRIAMIPVVVTDDVQVPPRKSEDVSDYDGPEVQPTDMTLGLAM